MVKCTSSCLCKISQAYVKRTGVSLKFPDNLGANVSLDLKVQYEFKWFFVCLFLLFFFVCVY